MIDPIHLIRVELDDQPRIVFEADYRSATGPLPRMVYPLIGLWSYEGLLVRALFGTRFIPIHEHEPILHRYEGPTVAHASQAAYRYYTVPGYAGMTLTDKGFIKAGVPLIEMWASLSKTANYQAVHAGLNKYNTQDPPTKPTLVILKDQLGNLPEIVLATRPEERTTEDHEEPSPEPR